MDGPSDFYSNIEYSKGREMTPFDYTHRKLAINRGYEIGFHNESFVPTLPESFFGTTPKKVSVPNFGKVSIEEQRHNQKSLSTKRVFELSNRRKITASSEKHKFF